MTDDAKAEDFLDAAPWEEEPADYYDPRADPDWKPVEDEGEALNDPFHPNNVQAVQLIVQMRIYDALMSILAVQDEEASTRLHELHSNGKVLGSLPYIDLSEG